MLYGEHISVPGVYAMPEFNEKPESDFVRNLTAHWIQIRDFILKHDSTLSGNADVPEGGPYPHKLVWVTEPIFKGSLYPKVTGPYEVVNFQ